MNYTQIVFVCVGGYEVTVPPLQSTQWYSVLRKNTDSELRISLERCQRALAETVLSYGSPISGSALVAASSRKLTNGILISLR